MPEPPRLDREAVARAEQALDAASRDRERAEGRADEAARRLAGRGRAGRGRRPAARAYARVPRPRPEHPDRQAAARGGFLRAERDKLKGEVAALATVPRPKAKVLSNKNPVARPSDGDEYHFEVRRNRVSFIDLDRLLALVKADAMLRIRLSESARAVDSRVGPVGAFLARIHDGAGRCPARARRSDGPARDLVRPARLGDRPRVRGPGRDVRGDPQPISEFARAINRLNPTKATITMWVYPDWFALFRKLRDDLQARGYLVAARPFPKAWRSAAAPPARSRRGSEEQGSKKLIRR